MKYIQLDICILIFLIWTIALPITVFATPIVVDFEHISSSTYGTGEGRQPIFRVNESTKSVNSIFQPKPDLYSVKFKRDDDSIISSIANYNMKPIPPDSPSELTAKCISKYNDPDGTIPAKYQIELKWKDNSNNKDGFQIYRVFKSTTDSQWPPNGRRELAGSVGKDITTFVDTLAKPDNVDDQYCYQVVSYLLYYPSVAIIQKHAESNSSNWACAYVDPYHNLPYIGPDTDHDGVTDSKDQCPYDKGVLPTGCPDGDFDGFIDLVDACPNDPYFTDNGCPIKYNLRWMGMKVLNDPYHYYEKSSEGIDTEYNNEPDDKWPRGGYEPYLIFSWTNGMLNSPQGGGMLVQGINRWCCGEDISVSKGLDYEPDEDSSGEEYPLKLDDLRKNGLTVFPAVSGKFSAIDEDSGLVLATTLMERDWSKTFAPDNQASALQSTLGIGSSVGTAVGACAGTAGPGCFLGIGMAMKSTIETILGLSQPATTITVDDADDYEGTEIWHITRNDADYKTSGNGAYAFYFDMPMTYKVGCRGVSPCTTDVTAPKTMRARLYFCLYREGTPESSLMDACSSYEMVSPWPQVP